MYTAKDISDVTDVTISTVGRWATLLEHEGYSFSRLKKEKTEVRAYNIRDMKVFRYLSHLMSDRRISLSMALKQTIVFAQTVTNEIDLDSIQPITKTNLDDLYRMIDHRLRNIETISHRIIHHNI